MAKHVVVIGAGVIGLSVAHACARSGLRPCSPDGLPYLGRTRRWRNLTVATGHAMMGLSLAPATGRIVAQLVHGEPLPFDLRLLSPDRYG